MGSNSPDRHIHLLLHSPHGTKTFKRIRAQGCRNKISRAILEYRKCRHLEGRKIFRVSWNL